MTVDPVSYLLGVGYDEMIRPKVLQRRRTNMRCLIVGAWLTEPIWPVSLCRWTLQSRSANPSVNAPKFGFS